MATKKQRGSWGIDIGQCAFKAIRLEVVDGKVTATAFDYIEHPKILSQPDADPDLLTREALTKFLERNNLRGDQVVVSIPGQSGLARFVKLPPVEEKKIGDIVQFEAKQQIPFPLDEVIWDYQKVGSGVVTDGFAMETEIGLFAMKKDLIHRFLQQFLDVKVEVSVVQMAPLALCNYIAYDLLGRAADGAPLPDDGTVGGGGEGSTGIKESAGAGYKKRCAVVLDIGTDNSNLVISDGDRIIWQRPIPLGGNHFTRALTKEMKLTFAKAEHLKRNATKSPDLRQILAALKPVLNEFVGEVQRSLGYFTNTHRDAHVEYMMGLGSAFRLPGLQKYLAEKLQLDVRKLGKLERVAGDTVLTAPVFANNVLSFATAYGAALQGLDVARIRTNLLPTEIRMERLIRSKKPWAVATAAALLVGVSATTAGYALAYYSVAGKPVAEATAQCENKVKEAANYDGQYRGQEAKVKENEDAVKSIIAGQDERLNWILLSRFVNESLPVPALRLDGKFKSAERDRLTYVDRFGKDQTVALDRATFILAGGREVGATDLQEGQEISIVYQRDPGTLKYWGTPEAKRAFIAHWSRLTSGKSAEAKSDDDGVEDLIQVNIETVDALYSADLNAFFTQVQQKRNYKDGMPNKKDAENLPQGKGWVVELRGYTYNKGRFQFVMDTLVENLARKAEKAATLYPPTDPGTPGTPAPAASRGEKAEKSEDPAVQTEDHLAQVVASKVSHVVLYDTKVVENPDPTQFPLISQTMLAPLVGPATPGPWQPIVPWGAAATGGTGAPGMQMPGMPPGMPAGRPMIHQGEMARPSPTVPGAEGQTERKGPGSLRTEFIVLFVWREPTPSDDRMENMEGGMPSAPAPAAPAESPSAPAPAPAAPGGATSRNKALEGL